ncbi:MAG: alpha/beta hydrolase-fold protein [Anaerolineales bacterium]|nr:alpha/beta hydrolase-fold protein [Anaerolineales bacterium]
MRKQAIFLIFFSVLLNACIPTLTPEQTPAPISAPTQMPTPDLQLTKTAACAQYIGTVERFELDSEHMLGPQWISVYTPPCYDPGRAEGYPVLYTFHGQQFDDSMWFNLGAADYLDVMIAAGESQPFLVVSIFEEYYYRAVRGNKFPDAVIKEIIPWVDNNFNTCAERACRAVGGISRGAAWAMRLGLTFPDLFSAIGIHSLPSYLGGPDQVRVWVEDYPKDLYPRITMDSGRFDPEVKSAAATQLIFNQKGIPHDWHLNEGLHDKEYWGAQMETYMRWYAGLWN